MSVLKPIQSIEEVQASLATFGDGIADRLDGRKKPPEAGGGEPVATFSYREVFDDLGDDLGSLHEKLVATEDEHVRRLATATAHRRRSRELGDELYDQQKSARRILGGAYDPERAFELAAVSGTTPRGLKALEEQADQTVKLLVDPAVELPEAKFEGMGSIRESLAEGLKTRLDQVREARTEYLRARKAAILSRVAKDEAIQEFQATFPWIAQTFEALSRLVGERELADRIRTSLRRVTRNQAEEGDGATSDEDPSEETASAETSETSEV